MTNKHKKILYIGDNLPIMLGMESETVDLIYTDPPFKTETFRKGKTDTHSFDDTWSDAQVDYAHAFSLKTHYPEMWEMIVLAEKMHSPAMHNYLAFMAPRIVQMHRLLKPTGSLYLHCDPNANVYLRMLLDCIFGRKGFRNEIVWHYQTGGASKRYYSKKHDTIFFYVKSMNYKFNADEIMIPRTAEVLRRLATGNESATRATTETKLPMDVWTDIQALNPMATERTGYDTQKPLTLVDRIIQASSNEGDVVMDPFCGCATTCMSASGLKRQWIGIDQNEEAAKILRDRLSTRMDTYDFETNAPVDAELQKPIPTPKREVTGYKKIAKSKAKLLLLKRDYEKYGHSFCKGCFKQLDKEQLTIDHILAQDKGGLDELENFQLLCTPCNSKKGNKDMDFLYRRLDDERRRMQMEYGNPK